MQKGLPGLKAESPMGFLSGGPSVLGELGRTLMNWGGLWMNWGGLSVVSGSSAATDFIKLDEAPGFTMS